MAQHEIRERDVLLDEDGTLKHRGYSKSMLLDYNPENISIYPLAFLHRLRKKEWDYYGTLTKDFYFSVCVADVGYIGLVFAYFIDFDTKELFEKTIVTPLGRGCRLPQTSQAGDVHFHQRRVKISFLREAEQRRLQVDWPQFNRGIDLAADLELQQPRELESMVISTPIGERRFYYNHKINCMPTSGHLSIAARNFDIEPDRALSSLDWGRGVWDYSTYWVWASASGFLPNRRRVGLNLGCGFGDLSAATENCFYLDNTMTKLGWVNIEFDAADHSKPWRFTEENQKLDLVLTPFFDKETDMNLLVLKTQVHQMFGAYSGTLLTDDGEKINIDGLIGWAEEHHARW